MLINLQTKEIVAAIVVIKIKIKNQNHILVEYIIIKKDKKKQGIIQLISKVLFLLVIIMISLQRAKVKVKIKIKWIKWI